MTAIFRLAISLMLAGLGTQPASESVVLVTPA
jgi:hypothetical protein